MSFTGTDTAADVLADLRLRLGGEKPLDDLPEPIRPRNLIDAYAIQARLREKLAARSPGEQSGWKIGCTTPVMQKYLGRPHPCAGTLYSGRLMHRGATLVASDYFTLGLECEIAVRLGQDLPVPDGVYERDDMFPAIDAVMASIEIVEHRFRDFSKAATPSLVADDFFSAGCVLGNPISPRDAGDLATLRGGFAIDGVRPAEIGTGAEILGHPLNALAWLADHVARLGSPLRAGQIVTLGSVVKTIYPEPGQRIAARFTRLPTVGVDII